MKIATKTININPQQPIRQMGYIEFVDKIEKVHDNLNARIVSLIDKEHVIFVSVDLLAFSIEAQTIIENKIHFSFPNARVIVSATHTHFGPEVTDLEYQNQVMTQLIQAIITLEHKEYEDVTYSFTYTPFQEVGTTRLSHRQAKHVYLELMTIYTKQTPLIHFMMHNAHPTIMSGHFNEFSSEYPGYAVAKLNMLYPNQFFTFMQGADGDISSRFTRDGQSYEDVKKLGDKFVSKVQELLNEKKDSCPLCLNYEDVVLNMEHEIRDLSQFKINDSMGEREKETLRIGEIVREDLIKNFDSLPKTALITKVDFGGYKMIFTMNELFSDFMDPINKSNTSLICYSNGYASYVTPIGWDNVTYEFLRDSVTDNTKKEMLEIFRKLSND